MWSRLQSAQRRPTSTTWTGEANDFLARRQALIVYRALVRKSKDARPTTENLGRDVQEIARGRSRTTADDPYYHRPGRA